MNWLLLYYDLNTKKYVYRIFGDLKDCYKYREKLIEHKMARTLFCYKLFGKSGGFI